MHSILIFLIIALIVAVQIKVALNAIVRINFLKQIVPGNENFETVTVYVAESQIKTISTEYILQNLEKFGPPETMPDIIEVNVIKTPPSAPPATRSIDDAINYESMIWVVKENDKKEIPFKLLRRYEQLGWEQIH